MSNKTTINDQIKSLEAILDKLESGDTDIEKSIQLYKEGKKLLKSCTSLITEMEQELTIIDEKETDESDK